MRSARDYAAVRDWLITNLGPPEVYEEEGRFVPNLGQAIARGAMTRRLEWPTAEGRLRFGVPRRTDRTARLEILHAPSLPSGNAWGIEGLR